MASMRARTTASTSEVLVSVVVPAYKECGNLRALFEQVFDALESCGRARHAELLIVDDNSQDGSEEVEVFGEEE